MSAEIFKRALRKIKISNKKIDGNQFRVSIFGSARIKKNDPVYREVYKLGKMLGERGIDVVTGGGPGLMEAANKGHASGNNKNTHSIGLGIKLPREQKFNKHLDVREEFGKFTSRLDKFMILSNAVIVAPGGVGTLLEFLYTWQLAQVNHICHIPIILMGDDWKGLIKWLENYPLKKKFLEKEDLGLIYQAKNAEEAVKMIDSAYKDYLSGGKDYCKNYLKYKI